MAHVSVPTRRLRYSLTLHLHGCREPATIPDLIDAMAAAGVEVEGRPSKTISDALRTEVSRGRVVRLGRGRYRGGILPESTGRYLRHWLAEHAPERSVFATTSAGATSCRNDAAITSCGERGLVSQVQPRRRPR